MAPRRSSTHDHDETKRMSVFKQRFPGFVKKTKELQVLCGNSVAFICHAPDGRVYAWPEDRKQLSQISAKYNAQTDAKRKKNSSDLRDFPDPHLFDGLSLDQLKEHLSIIDSQLHGISRKKAEIVTKKILEGSSFS